MSTANGEDDEHDPHRIAFIAYRTGDTRNDSAATANGRRSTKYSDREGRNFRPVIVAMFTSFRIFS